jgi:hypothetical protein
MTPGTGARGRAGGDVLFAVRAPPPPPPHAAARLGRDSRRWLRTRGKRAAPLRPLVTWTMPATGTVLGASLGLGVQLYSNAVRKLPLLRSACPRRGCRPRRARHGRGACATLRLRRCPACAQTRGSTSSRRGWAAWWARTWWRGRCARRAPSASAVGRPGDAGCPAPRVRPQEKLTKDVADMEAKRAKRFAGAGCRALRGHDTRCALRGMAPAPAARLTVCDCTGVQ